MACYRPLKGFRSKTKTATGKRSIVFSPEKGYTDMPVELPCGQCIGCRLEKSRQWAIRCVHEAQLHKENCFITLTYDDKHLPEDQSLNLKHFQLFMKRLRKQFTGKKIRFFHCGEYGDINKRPHYHAILFGLDFQDKQLISQREGVDLYTSKTLEKLWKKGYVTLGHVTFESAAYVARYITKKVTGEDAENHYKILNTSTGELTSIEPEYATMSRRPGIGKQWIEKYQDDIYPKDFTTIRGKKIKPPKFYDKYLEETHSELYEKIKGARIRQAKKHPENNTYERLEVREKCKKIQVKQLKRNL